MSTLDRLIDRTLHHFGKVTDHRNTQGAFGVHSLVHSAYLALEEAGIKTTDDCGSVACDIKAATSGDPALTELRLEPEDQDAVVLRRLYVLAQAIEQLIIHTRRSLLADHIQYTRLAA